MQKRSVPLLPPSFRFPLFIHNFESYCWFLFPFSPSPVFLRFFVRCFCCCCCCWCKKSLLRRVIIVRRSESGEISGPNLDWNQKKNLVLSSPKFLCSVPRNFQVLTNLMGHRYIWNSYSFQFKGIKNPAKVELTAQPRAHTHHHWQTNPYLSTDVRAQTSVKMHLACAFPLGINKVCLP